MTDMIADELDLTAEERAVLKPSGGATVIYDRAQWAKTYLKKAGLVEYTGRGLYRTTDAGRAVLTEGWKTITREFLGRFDQFEAFVAPSPGRQTERETSIQDLLVHPRAATPDETLRAAHRELIDALASDLLDRIRAASPAFFEKLVVNLLLAMGYGGSTASVERSLTPLSGDGGIDGVIDQDPLGLDRVYVQAKRYGPDNPVQVDQVRAFAGSLHVHGAAKGVFVTTSRFTRGAAEEAERMNMRLVLIDGARLADLMIRHDVGCRAVETVVLKRLDEDFFEG